MTSFFPHLASQQWQHPVVVLYITISKSPLCHQWAVCVDKPAIVAPHLLLFTQAEQAWYRTNRKQAEPDEEIRVRCLSKADNRFPYVVWGEKMELGPVHF